MEGQIFVEQIRPTVAPEQHEDIDILLCIETKQENIWKIGIDQQSFLQVSLSGIVMQKQKYRTLAHWNTERQRYKIVQNKDS